MATTTRDIVDGAAKRLGLIRAGEALEAADAADILQALNDMLAGFEAKGLNLGRTKKLKLSNAFLLTEIHEEGLKAMLAERVAEDFGLPVTRLLARDARAGRNALSADYRLPDPMRVDRTLAAMPSQKRSTIR